MKKTIISICLAVGLGLTALTGCSGAQPAAESSAEPSASATATPEAATPAPTPSPTDEPSAQPSASESALAEEPVSQAAPSDIAPVAATIESPAAIGEWVESKRYSPEDSAYHTIYYRITNIDPGEPAQAAVDKYNSEDHVTVFEEIQDDDLEYCLLTYEVFFPEDYPAADYGITSADINFSARSPEGGAISVDGVTYIGLGQAYEVSPSIDIDTLFPGDTWTGQAVFAMVKDFNDYIIETDYFENEEEFTSYVAVQ